MATIYILTNIQNGKQYVGKTIRSFDRRLSEHLADAYKTKKNRAFTNAIRKYGIENFYIECLEVSNKLVNLWEKHLIKRWQSQTPNGYNISKGGDGFNEGHIPWNKNKKGVFSKQVLEMLSEKRKGKKPWNYNKKAPGIAKAKMKSIILIHPDGSEVKYNNITDACIENELQPSNTSKVLKGIRNHTKGFKARYIDE